jgi:hypothetical protein
MCLVTGYCYAVQTRYRWLPAAGFFIGRLSAPHVAKQRFCSQQTPAAKMRRRKKAHTPEGACAFLYPRRDRFDHTGTFFIR